MADLNLGTVFYQILKWLVYIIAFIAVSGIVYGGYILLRNELRYRYKVFVTELNPDGSFKSMMTDRGGVFVERKTKNKLFFLKKLKSSLSPDHIPFVLVNNKNAVFVTKRGSKSYSYTIPKIKQTVLTKLVPVLNAGKPVFDENGKQKFKTVEYKENLLDLHVGDEDVNWALNTYERNKKVFAQNTLMQFMPFIALGFTAIIIAVIFIYFFKELSVLKEFGAQMHAAAAELAAAKQGTVVVAGS